MAQRVWVVDDEPHIRTAMLAVLSELGYETRGFADAEELYTALVEEGAIPDLLVLDQRLPDEYGSTIVHSLRERPQYRDIPVLFVTAIDDEEASPRRSAVVALDADRSRPQQLERPRRLASRPRHTHPARRYRPSCRRSFMSPVAHRRR